jgi:oxygen-independent coproporphyrinogen III oxidase
MKLILKGHDYKYAVEQIMLMMYPKERPEYTAQSSDGLSASVILTHGAALTTAVTKITSEGETFSGISRVQRAALTDKLTNDRLLQKIIKLSFYKAAVLEKGGLYPAGIKPTGIKPAWGALTGIRPGKIVTKMLERGFSDKKALSVLAHDYFVSPERGSFCLDTAKAGILTKKALAQHDAAIYIGIPFCPTRCHYCSFVSHSVEKSFKLIEPFLEALYKEIDALSAVVLANGLNIISVYIGGGTPTTLSGAQLDGLIRKLASAFDMKNVREFTVEAGRPDTITSEKLDVLYKQGVTRLSINPQTMSDDVLAAIGRRHTAEDVLRAVREARAAGFSNINMDLIAGLPTDTTESFRNSLQTVLALNPENITVHTLSLKKGTRITLESMDIPDGSAVAVMLNEAGKQLRGHGYAPYYLYRQKFMSGGFENIGWCRPGFMSLYNILIMEELVTILALGGGGATKLVSPKTGRIERIFNPKYPHEYIGNIDRIIENKSGIAQFYTDAKNFPAK